MCLSTVFLVCIIHITPSFTALPKTIKFLLQNIHDCLPSCRDGRSHYFILCTTHDTKRIILIGSSRTQILILNSAYSTLVRILFVYLSQLNVPIRRCNTQAFENIVTNSVPNLVMQLVENISIRAYNWSNLKPYTPIIHQHSVVPRPTSGSIDFRELHLLSGPPEHSHPSPFMSVARTTPTFVAPVFLPSTDHRDFTVENPPFYFLLLPSWPFDLLFSI